MTESISFDRIADRYDETRGGLAVGRSFGDAVAEYAAPPPARIVELGVGTGLVALALTERGYDVLGADLSPKMIASARERIGARVVVADATRSPFASASCDVVVAARVLHVVGDPGAALAEAARLVRPGGRVVVILAGSDREVPDDDIAVAVHGLHQPRQRGLDEDTVLGLADGTGALRLVERGYTKHLDYEETPREHAEKIRTRTWSGSWDTDEETWARNVAPIVYRLLALPDPDRPRRRRRAQRLYVFARR